MARAVPGPHPISPPQVIRPEPCGACGSRLRFGRAALRCRQCQLLLHPKCRERCPGPCTARPRPQPWPREVSGCPYPWAPGLGAERAQRRPPFLLPPPLQGVLADFAPPTAPLVPALVVQCVTEVETRGLAEVGDVAAWGEAVLPAG